MPKPLGTKGLVLYKA